MARAMGRYELLRPLARGGMAEVFVARRRSAGVEKLLVIKRIRAERAGNARFLELFVREARLSMSLAHGNIVPVFDFGRIGDQVFLAMERVEGKDLGSTLGREGVKPLSPLVAAFVAAECCRALAYAHDRRGAFGERLGVVHRDVTPRNVLLSWSGEVKLTDFGIAALAGEESGRLVGTPAYMAPEQARGESVDARSDLYALGLVLREAVTGVRARKGSDRDTLVDAARSGELAPWPDGTSPALVAIVDRATAVSPDERYRDARAMLAALDEFIVGERAGTRGESPDRQLADWLAGAWETAATEDLPDTPIETADAESMFDDAQDVGTQTERSLAATADDPLPGDSLSKLRSSQPKLAPAPLAAPRRRWPVVVGLVGLVALAAIAFGASRLLRSPATPSAVPDARPLAAGLDARELAEHDALATALLPDAPSIVPPDAAVAVVPAPRDAAIARVHHDAASARPPARDASIEIAVAKRKVRINARPWATFTVDGGSREYETISTVELAPGPHKIRFKNPELGVVRDVDIVVPPDRDIDHVEDLRR